MTEPTGLHAELLAAITEVERLCDVVDAASMQGIDSTAEMEMAELADTDRHRRSCEASRDSLAVHHIQDGTGGDWDTDPAAICASDRELWPCDSILAECKRYAINPAK